MLARGTQLKENDVYHLPDGTSRITVLHKGKVFFITLDTVDWPLVEKYTWHIERAKKTYYATTMTGAHFNNKPTGRKRMHRILFPDSEQVDHIDRNGLNNRRNNLRPATLQQNNMNRGKLSNTSSPYIGVCIEHKTGKWQSGIKSNGKRIALGRYKTQEEAAIVRDLAAIEAFGEFASLNFSRNFLEAYKNTVSPLPSVT